MLRRTSDVNLPMLERYLASKFSEIPANLRELIIEVAFSAAKKVALMHRDSLISPPNALSEEAGEASIRLSHGLSSIEPDHPMIKS